MLVVQIIIHLGLASAISQLTIKHYSGKHYTYHHKLSSVKRKKPFPSQSYPATGATALAGVKHQQRFSLQTCLVSRQRTSSPATPNPATAYLWFGQNGTKGRSCLPLDVVSHLNVWPFFFVLLIDSRGWKVTYFMHSTVSTWNIAVLLLVWMSFFQVS